MSTVDTIVHQEMIYYTCHYTYFYILSTVVGKVSSFGGAIVCHWWGLRLQLDSQPLEGDGASSWCWLSSRSGSSDRKLGNVCARGMKVIVRPLPAGKKKKQRRSIEHFFYVSLNWTLHQKQYVLFFSDNIFMVQLLLSYCPRWYLYIQMKEYRNNPGILKHLWCRRFSDDTKIQTQQDAIEKSTFHLEWATWFQSGLHCLLSSLFARSLPLI